MVIGNLFYIVSKSFRKYAQLIVKYHELLFNRKYCTTIVQNPMKMIRHPLKIHTAELFVEV